jgi:hypothetical protein
MEDKATPRPWRYESGSIYAEGAGRLIDAYRENPNTAPWERDANLRLATRAVNALDAVERLRVALAEADVVLDCGNVEAAHLDDVRDALRSALADLDAALGKP